MDRRSDTVVAWQWHPHKDASWTHPISQAQRYCCIICVQLVSPAKWRQIRCKTGKESTGCNVACTKNVQAGKVRGMAERGNANGEMTWMSSLERFEVGAIEEHGAGALVKAQDKKKDAVLSPISENRCE